MKIVKIKKVAFAIILIGAFGRMRANNSFDKQKRLNEQLFLAIELADAQKAQKAINEGAEVNAYVAGNTPLVIAVYEGEEAMVKMLIAAGAKVDVKDQYGQTLLQLAKRKSNKAILKMLTDAGAK